MKTETKHTPGPWHVGSGDWSRGEQGGSIMAIYDANHICLALAYSSEQGPPPTKKEQEANAALIARAPDLLAENERLVRAIKGLLRHCVTVDGMPDKDKGRTDEQQQALDAATAALNHLKP